MYVALGEESSDGFWERYLPKKSETGFAMSNEEQYRSIRDAPIGIYEMDFNGTKFRM